MLAPDAPLSPNSSSGSGQTPKSATKQSFYTKPATNADAAFYANQIGGHYWGNLVNQEVYLDWVGACDGKEQDLVTPRVAEAIALEAKGTAYVIMTSTPDPNSVWMKYEYPALKKQGVTIMKLKPGGKPVPYNSGSPPPSRSPSPQPPSRSSSQSSSKSSSSKKGGRRRSVYPRAELYMRALEAGLFERALEFGLYTRTGFAFGE